MSDKKPDGTILAVSKNADPGIPKNQMDSIQLLEEFGVEGDYHAGNHIRHRYLAKKDPEAPNHRHVLMIDDRILTGLAGRGIQLSPGQMGENLIIQGIDVMALEIGTQLAVGQTVLEITEIRDPCHQLNQSHPDLFQAVIQEVNGKEEYTAGIFARILRGGKVTAGDPVYLIR